MLLRGSCSRLCRHCLELRVRHEPSHNFGERSILVANRCFWTVGTRELSCWRPDRDYFLKLSEWRSDQKIIMQLFCNRQYFHTSTLYADTRCTLQSWDLTSTWWHTVRAYAKVLSREGNLVTVKMPSSEAGKLVTRWFGRHDMDCQFFAQVRLIPEDCWCTIGKARWAIAWNIVKWYLEKYIHRTMWLLLI